MSDYHSFFVEWMTEFGGYKTFVVKNEDEEVYIFFILAPSSLISLASHTGANS